MLHRSLVPALLAAALLSLPLGATDVWVPIGPDGGAVSALAWAPDGRTVLAGTPSGGIFRSLDGGRSWSASAKGLRGEVNDIAFDRRQSSTIYAATTEGLFRSLDAGTTWWDVAPPEATARGLTSARAVVTVPAWPGTVFASFDAHELGGLFRSTDRGATWKAVGRDLPSPTLAFAAHPREPYLLAGTWGGLFESSDGVYWSPAGLDLPVISEVLIDPHRPDRVLAVALQPLHGLTTPVIYIRENGGRWRRSAPLAPEGTIFGNASLAADPVVPDLFYAGIPETLEGSADLYRSTDGGRRWKAVHSGEGVAALAAHPRRSGVLLAGSSAVDTGTALLRTENHGATWSPSGSGLQAFVLSDFAAASGSLYSLLRCCSLWRSEAGGGVWQRVTTDPTLRGLSVAPAPSDPALVYLGAYNGIWKSPDRGETWSRVGKARDQIWDLAVAPDDTLYALQTGTLLRIPDLGASGSKAEAGLISRLLALGPGTPWSIWLQAAPSAQYPFEGAGPNRVFRSTDGGLTWTTPLTLGPLDELITAIAPHPADPRHALVAFTRFVSSPYAPAAPRAGGVFRTTDGGLTWELSRLPNRRSVFSLAVDPRDPARVYAGSFGAVFVSADGGATWTALGQGLPASRVDGLAFDPDDPDRLYAATLGGGVWRLARLE